MEKPKSINSLMKYMRDKKKIQINAGQKRKLRYMGYFHGYKGYRFHSEPNKRFNYQSFNELQAVYDFDMSLKTIMYPKIMFLETTLKNYALEIILDSVNSKRFADVYSKLLNGYKNYPVNSSNYNKAIKKRMKLRNKIYNEISYNYENNFIVKHFYDKDEPLPIWAVFEMISLGEFGTFLECLNKNIRSKISTSVGINYTNDKDVIILHKIVYALKDLRNAIAHNNVVFDTRFKTGNIDKVISQYIEEETDINNISFETIVDYVVLISVLMKLLKCPKSDIIAFNKAFEQICESFRKKVSTNIYMSIVYSDTRNKLQKLKYYL